MPWPHASHYTAQTAGDLDNPNIFLVDLPTRRPLSPLLLRSGFDPVGVDWGLVAVGAGCEKVIKSGLVDLSSTGGELAGFVLL